MKNNYYIYFHINPLTNKVFYVGKGKGKRAWSKGHRSQYWKNTVNKYGYIIDIVEDNLTEEIAFEREKFYIQKIGRKNLCNLTDGGEGQSGIIRSEETRKKISECHKGKKLSEETKSKISESKKGIVSYIKTDEQKKKISERQLGRIISDKTKEKISNTLKGNIPWNKGKKGVQKLSEETRKKMSESHKKRHLKN